MTNKKAGSRFETDFCRFLFENGFWVHNFAQNYSGQPVDIIAARNTNAYLIDCKVCSRHGFAMSRIEENQQSSMSMWEACGNDSCFFAMQLLDGAVYMIAYDEMNKLRTKASYLSEPAIRKYGVPIEKWVTTA